MFWEAVCVFVTDSDGDLDVFYIYRDSDGLKLKTNNGHPENQWNPDNRWILTTRNLLHFSPDVLFGEFCFGMREPCQAPRS